MPIKLWPAQEKPRERLIALGPDKLSDAELLAILLNHGTKGVSALDLARDLIKHFKGLRGILASSLQAFSQLPGLGMAKYCQIQAAIELSRRYLKESLERSNVILNAEDAKNYLITCLRDYEHEVFACLFLDNQHRVICFEKLFHGSINMTQVYPREVVKKTLQHNAAAIIAAHNHPSGVAEPSQADKEMTQKLSKTLALIEVRLLDHFVIGDPEVVSFSERGLLT